MQSRYRLYKPLLSETVDIPVCVKYRDIDKTTCEIRHDVLFDDPKYCHLEVPVELNPKVWKSVMDETFFEIHLPEGIHFDITNPTPQKSLQTYKAKGIFYAYFDWCGMRFRFKIVSD